MSLASDSDDGFDFPEFTEQDFAEIDDIVDKHLNGTSSPPGDMPFKSSAEQPTSSSHIVISIEKEPMIAQANRPKFLSYAQLSPFETYRSRKIFTVTDLSSPAWCELQFDYGLRQKRHRKVENRPTSFVSAEGKTINVATKTALNNERTVEAGKAVHKKLEREIRPEQTVVATTSKEEWWGLRLINMMVCIEDLQSLGFCREMPVFGIIHDHVITGIIDEISWTRIPESVPAEKASKRDITSAPSTPQKPKRTRSNLSSPDKRDMTALFDGIPLHSTAESSSPRPVTHQLKLLDNKTRYLTTLPSDRDTLPSRIQLMLYHRLLTGLISASPNPQALDLRDFWSRIQVNPALTFSPQFCEESGLSIQSTNTETEQARTWSLNDLVQLWMALVSTLEISGVDATLTLSYRTRAFKKTKTVQKQKVKTATQPVGQSTIETVMMAQAIKDSLQSTDIIDDALLAELVADEIRNSGIGTPEPSKVEDTESTASEEEAQPHGNIIGVKSFSYDESLLTDYLIRVFDWWHGLRPPQGVEIEDSGRCRSCEYRDDCEWRISKAAEALEKVRSPIPGSS